VSENDGRKPVAHLKEVTLPFENVVVELTDSSTGELIYCHRVYGKTFKAPVFKKGAYTFKVGKDKPESILLQDAVAE
jgi:hypothetical protein